MSNLHFYHLNPSTNPVTEFTINNQLYIIFPIDKENEKLVSDKYIYRNSQRYNIVGELKIHRNQYIIVQLDNLPPHNNSTTDSKSIVDILTRRELQIVILVAEGKVNKQIADHLKISKWTVSTHLRRIFTKLGVDSRAAMIYKCSKMIERVKRNSTTDST